MDGQMILHKHEPGVVSGKTILFLKKCLVFLINIMLVGGCKMSTNNQPVIGIGEYKKYNNETFEPHFASVLPENWIVNYQRLTSQEGGWISVQGPFDESGSRHIALDIQMIQRSDDAILNSLNDFSQYSLKQESIGNVEVKINEERTVGNINGWEYRIVMSRSIDGPNGIVDIILVKQWTIIPKNGYFVCVYFESPSSDFDTYLDVYERFLRELIFEIK